MEGPTWRSSIRFGGALGLCVLATGALALEDGTYAVRLVSLDGAHSVTVGSVDVQQDKYALSMNDAAFTDHFLSVRPFK